MNRINKFWIFWDYIDSCVSKMNDDHSENDLSIRQDELVNYDSDIKPIRHRFRQLIQKRNH